MASSRTPRHPDGNSRGRVPEHGAAGVPDRADLLETLNWESRRSAVFFGLLNRVVAAQLGLNVSDVEALGVLVMVGTITPTQLAGLLGIGTGSVTLVIDRLERAGFVRRVRGDSKDRRSITVEILPQRAREAGALYAPMQNAAAAILDDYDDDALATITQCLTRVNDMLRDAGADLAGGRPD